MGQLTLQTSDAGFINSGDMRLILRGQAPSIVVGQPAGLALPETIGLTLTGQAPSLASSAIQPGTGSLSFSGVGEGWGLGLSLVGHPPTASVTAGVVVPTGALNLAFSAPLRAVGLEIQGQDGPLIQIGHNRLVPSGAMSFAGIVPATVVQSAGNLVAAPELGSLVAAGRSASIHNQLDAGSPAGLSLASTAPTTQIDKPIAVSTGSAVLASDPIVQGAPDIVIGEGANEGTVIQNLSATTDSGNRYEICDRSGFRAKPGQLVETWDGLMVLPEFWEPRNMQDFVSSRAERQSGAQRPEPVGSETFVEDTHPNGVSAEDL